MTHNASFVTNYELRITDSKRILLNTVRYFDLFDQPVTAVQAWQIQVEATHVQSLRAIREALAKAVTNGTLSTRWGFYFLPGRQELAHAWLRRHALAQHKWKLTRRIVRWLHYVPCVRMIAMSGSLAAGNTRESSDLDLFVIGRAQRIWLARFGLLLVTALLGRRRRHWDRQAPDKVCLNHYVTDDALAVSPDIRNMYTAILYRSLISLTGPGWRERFLAANSDWIGAHVQTPLMAELPTQHALAVSRFASALQGMFEALIAEPLWNWLEYLVERAQRVVIHRHTQPGRPGRVVVNSHELAFHPDTKVPAILARYYQ